MNLTNLVSTYPSGTDPAIIYTQITTPSIQMTDSTLYSYRALVTRFGEEFTARVMGGLKAAASQNPILDATYLSMCNMGIDFSNPVTQVMIDQLTPAVFSNADAIVLKSIGVWYISKVEEALGKGVSVNQQQVTDAYNQYWASVTQTQQINNLMSWWVNIHNTVVPQIQNGSMSQSDIKTLIANS